MHLIRLAKNLFILTFFYASTAIAQYCYDPINNFYYDCGASDQGSAVFFSIMIPSYSGYDNRSYNNNWSGQNRRHHYRSWDDRNQSNWDRRNEMWQGGWQGNNWQNQHRNWNNQGNQWQNRQQHNWQNRQRNWHH